MKSLLVLAHPFRLWGRHDYSASQITKGESVGMYIPARYSDPRSTSMHVRLTGSRGVSAAQLACLLLALCWAPSLWSVLSSDVAGWLLQLPWATAFIIRSSRFKHRSYDGSHPSPGQSGGRTPLADSTLSSIIVSRILLDIFFKVDVNM